HLTQSLQIDEGRRSYTQSSRLRRAVGDQIDPKLAFRRFYRMIVIARRRFDHLRHFLRHYRAFGQFIDGLQDDLARLPHLFHAHQIAIVRVAVLSIRDVELKIGIALVGMRFAYIPLHARTAQRRPGQSHIYCIFGGDDSYSHSAAQPDAICIEHRLHFVDARRKSIAELLHLIFETFVSVVGHSAHAKGMASQSRAEEVLEDLQYLLTLAKSPKEDRHRAYVERVSRKPEQMARKPVQFRKRDAQVLSALRHFKTESLLYGLDVTQPVRYGGDVVGAVEIRS